MKFLLTICLIAAISTKGIAAQNEDVDVLFSSFVNSTLSGLKAWLNKNNLVPDLCSMDNGGSFKFKGLRPDNAPYHQLEGWVGEERWYYGYENNHRALSISSNLSTLSFSIDLGFGGADDFVTGTYTVNGSLLEFLPIQGNGTFRRNIQIRNPLHFPQGCEMEVSEEGYFELISCFGSGYGPDFSNMTLNDLDAGGNEWAINPFFNGWYSMQISDFPSITLYWFMYMREVFAVTPIVDIIGEELPPTISKVEAGKFKEKKARQNRERIYDAEKRQFVQKVFIGF